MTPSRLRTFLAVLETGSARAAAVRLQVTESAVSASLAALQRDLGVTLFERHGRGLAVTEAGTVFADYARQILGLLDEGVAAARQGVDAGTGRLRLAAVTTAGEYLVPGLLAGFRARHPGVEVTLQVGVRDRVLGLLADRQADVVVAGRPRPGSGLVTRGVRANALVLVAAPQAPAHEAPRQDGPEGGRAADRDTWLLREEGSGTRATTLALLQALQLDPPLLSLGSHGAVVASAVLGLGVTLVSADAVADHLADGRLVTVPARGTPLSRPWHLLTGRAPTATARLFLRHVTDPAAAGGLAFTRRATRRGDGGGARRS